MTVSGDVESLAEEYFQVRVETDPPIKPRRNRMPKQEAARANTD